jgi:hypothetical protein
MNYREKLLDQHSLSNTISIAEYIGEDKERFYTFLQLFYTGDQLLIQRGSWVLSKCYDINPVLFAEFIPRILELLDLKDSHDALKRNVLRILQHEQIPEFYQAKMWDYCFHIMQSRKEPIACRAHAMSILTNLCDTYPELWNECLPFLQELTKSESAGLRSRANHVLRKVKLD